MQKKFIIAVLFLNVHAVSYSMNNFSNDAQKKNIDPATCALLFTQHQINSLLEACKAKDETFENSNGNYRKIRNIGRIISVEPVQKEFCHQQAKL